MKRLIIFLTMITMFDLLSAQEILPLYSGKIPNSKNTPDKEKSEISPEHILVISNVSRPTLTIFLAPKATATGAAVIVVPGGGYRIVAAGHEGYDVAKEFNKMGVSAFVLKYRIPDDSTMIDKEIGPIQDAQRAIQLVRQNAGKWGIDPHRLGILGFSAGGHLASTAATHFNKAYINNSPHQNLRPDFEILLYPVISFSDSIGHIGSRDNLLGKNPSPEKIREYSNELQVTPQTPPAFLVHARNDDGVLVQNSIDYCAALKKNHVPCEIYIYEKGGHGFGLVNETSSVKWMDLVGAWMKKNGWLKG
jgi:acetyl esterase/lipase